MKFTLEDMNYGIVQGYIEHKIDQDKLFELTVEPGRWVAVHSDNAREIEVVAGERFAFAWSRASLRLSPQGYWIGYLEGHQHVVYGQPAWNGKVDAALEDAKKALKSEAMRVVLARANDRIETARLVKATRQQKERAAAVKAQDPARVELAARVDVAQAELARLTAELAAMDAAILASVA